jgi:hypothetical protein
LSTLASLFGQIGAARNRQTNRRVARAAKK